MFKYYRNMFNFVRSDLGDSSAPEAPEFADLIKSKEINTNEWFESNLFAGVELSKNIIEPKYKVFIRESLKSNFIDITIDDRFGNPVLEEVPLSQAQEAVDSIMQLDLITILNKQLIWNGTKLELSDFKGDLKTGTVIEPDILSASTISIEGTIEENNTPITIEELQKQKSFFDNLLSDKDISADEINSIDFDEIKTILRKSFSLNQVKNQDFIDARAELTTSILMVSKEYSRRLALKDPNFPSNSKFKELISYMEGVENDMFKDRLVFFEKLKTMPLSEKLDMYTRSKDNDTNRYTILESIIEKDIKAKGNHLAYGINGEIVVRSNVIADGEMDFPLSSDVDMILIQNTVSNKDLRGVLIRDVITGTGVDITKESTNYEKTVNNILKENKILDKKGNVLVFSDLKNRKEEVIDQVNTKIGELKSSADKTGLIGKLRDLNFVLDYIENEKSYPTTVIEKAAEMSALRESGFDPTTNEGIDRIAEAFKSGKGIQTLLNDIMGANGGMVGAVLIIGSIIGLFVGGDWRKASFWILGTTLLGPAAEELLHKWGGGEAAGAMFDKASKLKSGRGVETASNKVDINIVNLPDIYKDNYKDLYKNNLTKRPSNIYEQDLAQIFSQLVQNQEVGDIRLTELKEQLKDESITAEDILGDGNIPQFMPNIIKSNKGDKINNRTIKDEEVKKFLFLLLSMEEEDDATIGDLFVSGKKKPTYYLDKDLYEAENEAINLELEKVPFSVTERPKLLEIIGRTSEIFSVENGLAKFSDEKRKNQINKIIEDLGKLKGVDSAVILAIIAEYKKIGEKIGLNIQISEYETKANKEGELSLGLSLFKDGANAGIGLMASMIGYFEIDPNIITLKELDKVNIQDLEDLINKGKDILTANKDTLSEEKKLEIKKIIIKLKEKKLALLRTKDKLNKITTQSTDVSKALADLIEDDFENYEKQLDKINIKSKPDEETIKDYYKLGIINSSNLVFLHSIYQLDDSILGSNGKALKQKAKEKLDLYNDKDNGFESNFKEYTSKKQKELISIFTTINLYTKSDDLVEFEKKAKEFNLIKEEWEIGTIKKDLHSIQSSLGFKSSYNNSSFLAIDSYFVEHEEKIKNKRIELQETIDVSIDITKIDPLDISKINEFITEVNIKKKSIESINKDIKEDKDKKIETTIFNLVEVFRNKLKDFGEKELKDIAQLRLSFNILTSKEGVGNGGNDKFEEDYENKIKELDKERNAKLGKDSLSESTQKSIIEFTKEYSKYSDLKRTMLLIDNTSKIEDILKVLGTVKSVVSFGYDEKTSPKIDIDADDNNKKVLLELLNKNANNLIELIGSEISGENKSFAYFKFSIEDLVIDLQKKYNSLKK